MEKVHFDDLTEINVPYGLLSYETKEALEQADLQACEWEHYTHKGWEAIYSPLNGYCKFNMDVIRAKPAPQLDIPWDFISDRYTHLAMGESGGWNLHTQKPTYNGKIWMGSSTPLSGYLFNLPTNIDPAKSLQTRPKKD